jgi:hypothetical protein
VTPSNAGRTLIPQALSEILQSIAIRREIRAPSSPLTSLPEVQHKEPSMIPAVSGDHYAHVLTRRHSNDGR